MSEQMPAQNTDRELWREREGDYYANSIHVTVGGGIGINVGGFVIVMPLARWHEFAAEKLDTFNRDPLPPTDIAPEIPLKVRTPREERNKARISVGHIAHLQRKP